MGTAYNVVSKIIMLVASSKIINIGLYVDANYSFVVFRFSHNVTNAVTCGKSRKYTVFVPINTFVGLFSTVPVLFFNEGEITLECPAVSDLLCNEDFLFSNNP